MNSINLYIFKGDLQVVVWLAQQWPSLDIKARNSCLVHRAGCFSWSLDYIGISKKALMPIKE